MRYSTKYIFDCAVQLTIKNFRMDSVLVGCPNLSLNQLVANTAHPRNILFLLKNEKTCQPFNDKLCLFRAIAVYRYALEKQAAVATTRMAAGTQRAIHAMLKNAYPHLLNPQAFAGVAIPEDIPRLEKLLEININIYTHVNQHSAARLIYLSPTAFAQTIHLHQDGQHVALIKNMDIYASRYICDKCNNMFSRMQNLRRHQARSCRVAKKLLFRNGPYRLTPTAFEEFEQQFPPFKFTSDDLYQPHFVTFDFESILYKTPNFTPALAGTFISTASLLYSRQHLPVS